MFPMTIFAKKEDSLVILHLVSPFLVWKTWLLPLVVLLGVAVAFPGLATHQEQAADLWLRSWS